MTRHNTTQSETLRQLALLAGMHAARLTGLRAANLRMHAAECNVVADAIETGEDETTSHAQVAQWINDYAAQINAEIEGN